MIIITIIIIIYFNKISTTTTNLDKPMTMQDRGTRFVKKFQSTVNKKMEAFNNYY